MMGSIHPGPASVGRSWTKDSSWQLGRPNAVAASGDQLVIARGPHVDLGLVRGNEVLSHQSWLLPTRVVSLEIAGGAVRAADTDGHAWKCDPAGHVVPTPSIGIAPERTPRWQAVPNTVFESTDGLEPLSVLDVAAAPRNSSLALAGWDLIVTTMDGQWLIDTTPGMPRAERRHPRPARALVGDERVWAVFDDSLQLLTGGEEISVPFELPLAAVHTPEGVVAATPSHTWRFLDNRVERIGRGASDLVVIDGRVHAIHAGTIWELQSDRALTGIGGDPGSLRSSRGRSRITATAAPNVVEVDPRTMSRVGQWSVDFGPLAAASVEGLVLICGGEGGLYAADESGVHAVDLDIPAAIDICAVADDAVVVATGAGVVRVEARAEPVVTATLALPGVSCLAARGDRIVACVGNYMHLLSARSLATSRSFHVKIDPRCIAMDATTLTVCGYDGIEVIDLG